MNWPLDWIDFDFRWSTVSDCQPNSAWVDWNLAKLAEELGGTSKSVNLIQPEVSEEMPQPIQSSEYALFRKVAAETKRQDIEPDLGGRRVQEFRHFEEVDLSIE